MPHRAPSVLRVRVITFSRSLSLNVDSIEPCARVWQAFGHDYDSKSMPGQLTLEQQFELARIKDQVGQLSKEEAQNYVVEVCRQMMIKNNLVKHLLKNA